MSNLFDRQKTEELISRLYPRIVSQIDHDQNSPTFGSCDRSFWMYRLHDFSSGIIQQSSLFFAMLSRNQQYSSTKKEFCKNTAKAINEYSIKIAHKNGRFDEYYPGENSYVATAFTSYAILKSAIILDQTEVIAHPKLKRTFEYFLKSTPTPAANQDVALCAFAALYAKTLQTHQTETRNKIQDFLTRKQFQSEFSEYGGFDLGYASVTLNYLSYIDIDGLIDTKEYIKKISFLCVNFISRNGSYGGEYGSRSTQYFLPFGLYYASKISPELTEKISLLNLDENYEKIDDRYLMHYFASSLAVLGHYSSQDDQFNTQFKNNLHPTHSNGLVYNSTYYYNSNKFNLYIGLIKGGAFYYESPSSTAIHESGYRIEYLNSTFSSSTISPNNKFAIKENEEMIQITCDSKFSNYRIIVGSPIKTIILRSLYILGPLLNTIFKKFLIKNPVELSEILFTRKITIDKKSETIEIEDQITGANKGIILTSAPPSPLRLVPSAKFYIKDEEIFGPNEKITPSLPWKKNFKLNY